VGFRFFAVREAQKRELTGWVRNKREDQVKVVAEGPPEDLEGLLEVLKAGPPLAWVAGVQVEWGEATGEWQGFGARASSW